jgi:acyl-ACP thioesterase
VSVVPDPAGRVYAISVRAGLADSGPSGRVRLDALARWLQDVAWADVEDAGLAERAIWVLRRVTLRVERFPAFGERVELRTACSGLGRMWAERTTTLDGDGGGRVTAVALWVALDPASGRPLVLDHSFTGVYETSAAGRRVRARLRHPLPPPEAAGEPWTFRRADLDLAGHVNNAAYWAVVEEALLAGEDPAAVEAELEFRGGATAGTAEVLRAGDSWWFTQPAGEVVASAVLKRH